MSQYFKTEKRWLKAELHAHCNWDPEDHAICDYSPEELIESAARLGYEVLAITCHNLDVWTEDLSRYARELGITLIPGMEVTVDRTRHVLVYNFRTSPSNLDTLERIRTNARADTMIIAPHPFFPDRSCLKTRLARNLDLFDAIEHSGFQIRGINFNTRGDRLAAEAGKPLVACNDIHFLWQLGRTYTWIWSEPDVTSILHAVKQGRVRIHVSPLSWREAISWWTAAIWRKAGWGKDAYPDAGISRPLIVRDPGTDFR